jgi:hypothetical protein
MAGHLFSNARLPSNNLDRRLVRALGSVSVGIFSKTHYVHLNFLPFKNARHMSTNNFHVWFVGAKGIEGL